MKYDTCALSVKDKDIVDTGMELTDWLIQFSQHLIKKHFSTIGGLCSTLLQKRDITFHKILQIVFCTTRHHWIVASNMDCNRGEVNVYDSLFKELDKETVDMITNYFGTENKQCRTGNSRCKVKCKMIDVQVQ